MLWIFLTLAAAPLQVARNAMQRGLVGEAGPWGATLVRFLFGLPFSLAIFGVVAFLTPGAAPHGSPWFWTWASVGATSQVLGMAALLAAMQRCGFGVATVLQLSALPVGALIGWLAFGDALSVVAWAGVALASVSLALVSWPWRAEPSFTGSALGLAAGLGFAMAFNSYRQATMALEPEHPIYAAALTVLTVQVVQSVALTAVLVVCRPQALRAVAGAWRSSLAAGFFGSASSVCWFAALALAPVGPVRALATIEAPIAAAVGRRLWRERPSLRQWIGGALATVGVAMTALG